MSTLADLLIEIGLDTKEVVKGAGEVEGKLKKTWAGVSKAAAIGGAAIGGALLAGIDSIVESSKPMALLEAQLGGGQEFASQMGKNAGAVYAKGVVDSMEEAAGAVRDVWQNKLVPEDAPDAAIQSVSNKLIALSKTTESSTKEVSNAVSQMLRTGLAKSADEAFDVIQKGVTNGANKADDLLDTFNEYGTQFRKLGLSGPEALGLISQAIKAGARDSDIAADALKEFSIRAIDGSKLTAQGFKALGLDAGAMGKQIAAGGADAEAGLYTVLDRLRAIKDPTKQAAAATALFGTQAEDLGGALFAMNPGNAVSSLGKLKGAATDAGNALEQSAGAKVESFKRQIGNAFTGELAKAIPAIEATFGFLQRNSAWVEPLAIALGVLAAAIGVMVAVQWAWNAALAVWPGTWIILGIVALVAIIVLLATKTKFFQTIWNAVWGFMKMVGAWFAGPFADFFVMLWQKIVAFAKGVWTAIKMYFTFWINIYKAVGSAAAAAVKWMIDKLVSFISYVRSIKARIGNSLSSMWDGLKSGFRLAINWVIGKWNSLHFTIPSFSVFGHTFGGGTIGVPNIPQLADGGIVKSTAGGTLVNVGEGGSDEAVVPLDRMPQLAGREAPQVIVQLVPGGEQEFRRWIRKSFRVKNGRGGGTVVLA